MILSQCYYLVSRRVELTETMSKTFFGKRLRDLKTDGKNFRLIRAL